LNGSSNSVAVVSGVPDAWLPTNLVDGMFGSGRSDAYSSARFNQSNMVGVSGRPWVAAWFGGPPAAAKVVSEVVLRARMIGGVSYGFPLNYTIYLTNPSNSSWVDVGTFTTQPVANSNGEVVIKLPSTYNTYGVHIMPNSLGKDPFNNYYFQLTEVQLGNRP
jgi:hypothetical protein